MIDLFAIGKHTTATTQTAKFAVRSEFIRGAILNAKGANRFSRAQNRYFHSFSLAKSAKAYSFCNNSKRTQSVLNSEQGVFCHVSLQK